MQCQAVSRGTGDRIGIRKRGTLTGSDLHVMPQKRHPYLITLSKSEQKRQCARMTTRIHRIPGSPHAVHGAAGYGQSHLFAPVRYHPLSWDARPVEKSPPPQAVLARGHASPLPRAKDIGRTRPLDPGPDDGVALAPPAGGVVEPRSPEHVATAQRWCHLSMRSVCA